MSGCPFHNVDPFKTKRQQYGVFDTVLDNEKIPMILRFKDVRKAAKDWETFSSDAPFRVPIPAEEDVRSVRQLPLEVDPPVHAEYRKIADPFFRKPLEPEFQERIAKLIEELVEFVAKSDPTECEIVSQFSLPLQSRALTYLLGVPEEEAKVLIYWGVHVFRTGDGKAKGKQMEDYINSWLDRAIENPGDDFYSGLTQATFEGRPLTREEMAGFCNIMFAGGRDTIINSVSAIVGYFAENPDQLKWISEDPKRILTATEEFVRWVSPVTHIGRVCPVETEVHGVKVDAGQRVTLAWASANHDETVFDAPEEIRLDRKPNPHVGFGFGTHNCLGANHARLIMRTLIRVLSQKVETMELVDFEEKIEREEEFDRSLSYESLRVKITLKE